MSLTSTSLHINSALSALVPCSHVTAAWQSVIDSYERKLPLMQSKEYRTLPQLLEAIVSLCQFSHQAFPLRPQLTGIEIPHWKSREMERLVFSKDSFYSPPTTEMLLFPPNNITLAFILPCEQGLLRQLVLVPGSDATQRICPSLMPQLAALSVPPLLLDESHRGSVEEDHGIYQSNLIKNRPAILIPLFIWPSSHICVFLINSQHERSKCQSGCSDRAQSRWKASCGLIHSGRASTFVTGQCGSQCLKVGISYCPSDPEGSFAQLIWKSLFPFRS